MMKPCNMYLNYKITNKLLSKVIDKDYNGKWKIRLNPHRFFLNKTNYEYWKNNIEIIEIHSDSTYTFDELDEIRKEIIRNLNMILRCIDNENHNVIKRVELRFNSESHYQPRPIDVNYQDIQYRIFE